MTRWSVVIPVYNERDYLPRTLLSLAAQTRAFDLIIVDNGSTDGCIDEAKRILGERGIAARILAERRAGQVHALKAGIDAADSELIAICDADTWYPSYYLERAEALFDREGEACVAAAAYLLPEKTDGWRARLKAWHQLAAARAMPRQNHTSGAAHCFRLGALRAAGGYDARIWPFVIKDHELMNRVLRFGRQVYDKGLWCITSDRRACRKGVRWTLGERIVYHLTPYALQHGFFHSFLASRFARRGLGDLRLRERAWDQPAEAGA